MLFLLTPFLFISIFLDCFSLVQRSFLRSVVRKLVRSTIFCSSFLPYHIFSFFHVLYCLRFHSFFEYNKSLCENVGSARSVDRNSKTIVASTPTYIKILFTSILSNTNGYKQITVDLKMCNNWLKNWLMRSWHSKTWCLAAGFRIVDVMQLSIRSLNVRISSVSFWANCCSFLTHQYSAYNR